jgi:hypothetical protein
MCSMSPIVRVRLWAGMASARPKSSGTAAASADDPISFRKSRQSVFWVIAPPRLSDKSCKEDAAAD